MAIHPSPTRNAAASTEWALLARRALLEWVFVQAVVLGSLAALLWPLVGWVHRVAGAVGQALALAGTQ